MGMLAYGEAVKGGAGVAPAHGDNLTNKSRAVDPPM